MIDHSPAAAGEPTARSQRILLAALLALFLCRAVVMAAVVPPWQGPDEPTHFNLALLLVTPDGTARAVEMERQIVQSMARHGWWEPHGTAVPEPLPQSFYNLGQQLGGGTYDQPLYYSLGAVVLRLTRASDLEGAYWRLRALGVVLALLSLWAAWAGTCLLFGPSAAIGATAVAVLVPQFALTALTVSPDTVVILCGALIWWQTGRILRDRRRGLSIALLAAAAVAAVLAKRSAVPLAGAAGLVTVGIRMMQVRVGEGRPAWTRLAVLAGAVAAAAIVAAVVAEDFGANLLRLWQQALRDRRGIGPALEPPVTIPMMLAWIPRSVDYAWLNAGWSRFPAPEGWLWVARTLTFGGFLGAAALAWRRSPVRAPLLIGFVFVAIQLLAVFAIAYRNAVMPEARFLFPVFAPALALMWSGWMWLTPAPWRRHAPVLLVATVAALDVTGFMLVIVPAYLP